MKAFKNKPKAIYEYVRAKQKVKTGVFQLQTEERDLTTGRRQAS